MDTSFNIEMTSDGIMPIKGEQTILEASLSKGIMHFNACGGKAKCSTCRVLVIEGEESLAVMGSPVNIAARLQDATKHVKVRLLGNQYDRKIDLKKRD